MILLAKLLQYGDADRTVSAGAVTERRCRAAKVNGVAVVTLLTGNFIGGAVTATGGARFPM